MAAVVCIELKGSMKDVITKLKSMSDGEYNGLKTSLLSATAKKERGIR